jgi:hypothetical protein
MYELGCPYDNRAGQAAEKPYKRGNFAADCGSGLSVVSQEVVYIAMLFSDGGLWT